MIHEDQITKKAKILVVDDELIVSANIKYTLQKYGYIIVGTAGSAEEALQLAKDNLPDLVLMDVNLKDTIDGIETAKRINEFIDTAIIFLTAYSDSATIERAREVGPYGYLIKPFENSELYSTVEMALYKHSIDRRHKESEKRFRELFDYTPIAYQSLDENGIFLDVNSDWLQLMGYSAGEVIGKSFGDFWSPETKMIFAARFNQFKKNGVIDNAELSLVRKNGGIITAILTGKVQYDSKGNIVKTHCIIIDISLRKQLEEKITKSEEKYRRIFENVQDVYYEISMDGIILEISPSIEMFSKGKYKGEDLIGKSIAEIYYKPEVRQELLTALQAKGNFIGREVTFKNRDGSLIECSLSSKIVFDDKGKPEKIIGSMHDITETKKAAEAIKRSEEKFSKAFKTIPEAVTIGLMEDGKYIEVNDGFLRVTGFNREEIIGRTSSDLNVWVGPNDRKNFIQKLSEDGFLKNFSIRYRMKNGEIRDFLMSSEIIELDGKKCSLNFFQDVTDRKRAEEELTKSYQRYNAIIQTTQDGFWIVDLDGNISEVNNSYCRMIGYKEEKLLKMNIRDVEFVESKQDTKLRIEEIVKEGFARFDTRHKCADGRILDVEVSTTFLKEQNKILAFFNDRTERKKSETELLEQMNEISKFNRLMVGREEKMIELKNEINQLLEKEGKNKKYNISFD